MQTFLGTTKIHVALPSNEHSCVTFDPYNGKPDMLASCGNGYPIVVQADNIHTALSHYDLIAHP